MVDQVQGLLRPATLVFLRVSAAMALLPGFGERSIPARIRLAMALAFTAVVLPAVADRHQGDTLLLPAAAEVTAGLLIGLSLRLMILALQTTAAIAAQSASLSQMFASAGAEPQPALGILFTLAATALALQAGLHVKLAALFILSHDLLPPGRFVQAADVRDWGIDQIAGGMALAFSLALPFVLAALLWNIALGAVNRAMPQLMVAFIGAPALSLGSLILSAILAPLMLAVWLGAFDAKLAAPFGSG
ncbi:MAG: flagellar biosynthesis protein FliR [Rhodobacter sp.]|nr:flagellar biosynthesis protein FliR [Rhodobacter sp.]